MRTFLNFLGACALSFLLYIPAIFGQEPYMLVLGTAQDGGYPHLGCEKECCKIALDNPELRRYVVSLALVLPDEQKWYLFEATPDMSDQIQYFRNLTDGEFSYLPEAIFISHAHIGHYTGLMEFGREAMNTSSVTVYALPRMSKFLSENGPWSQLVDLENIKITETSPGLEINLSESVSVFTYSVPHRDEFSETAGYRIITDKKKYLFIPDIDKWDVWTGSIISEIDAVEIAFIDGTFYSANELPGRSMDQIPHPFIVETIDLFKGKPEETRNKIQFIHLNHSNPALFDHKIIKGINSEGFRLAIQGEKY